MEPIQYSREALASEDGQRLLRWAVMHLVPRSARLAARQLHAYSVSDIVQSVVVRILKNEPKYSGIALSTVIGLNVKWYLFRVGERLSQRQNIQRTRDHIPLDRVLLCCSAPSLEDEACYGELRDAVANSVRRLDRRRCIVLEMRYGIGADRKSPSLNEVGAALKISRERVRQIECDAIAKLSGDVTGGSLRRFL